jgi:four helix bundle protein
MVLTKALYQLTRDWPKDEIYGLTSQVRRAAVSIPTNIAEGVGRSTPAEKARFGQIALGPAYELHTLLTIASSLEYASPIDIQYLQAQLTNLCKRLSSFIRYQEARR